MYFDIAAEMTMPPRSSVFAKLSKSVPPPQNETLTGVLEMITAPRSSIDDFKRAENCNILGPKSKQASAVLAEFCTIVVPPQRA